MTTDNIVIFPFKDHHKIAPPATVEEVKDLAEGLRYNQIEQVMEVVFPQLLENISFCGVSVNDASIKEHIFLHETIRATLCSYYGIAHPILDIVEKFTKKSQDGNEYIIDTNSLNRKRKPKTE